MTSEHPMNKSRLEAFSDGVLAIIITIMVLDLRPPQASSWSALVGLTPVFLTYVLSFLYLGIYWSNHHHMLHAAERVNGAVLWANLHLLFWLSLIPFATGWIGQTRFAPAPVALYGVDLLMAAIAYAILQWAILRLEDDHSLLRTAIGADLKGKLSPVVYLVAIACSFFESWISASLYVLAALMWLAPDSRIERAVYQDDKRARTR